MRGLIAVAAVLLPAGFAIADNVAGLNRLLCATQSVKLCMETDGCFDVMPEELDVPQFMIVDLKKKMLSTTQASSHGRTTPVSVAERGKGLIGMQGMENERLFSLIIDESTGKLTASISSDGFTVSVYGECTDASVK